MERDLGVGDWVEPVCHAVVDIAGEVWLTHEAVHDLGSTHYFLYINSGDSDRLPSTKWIILTKENTIKNVLVIRYNLLVNILVLIIVGNKG